MKKNNKIISGSRAISSKGITFLIFLFSLVCAWADGNAQTAFPAVRPDTLASGPTNGLGYINTALLDYSPVCTTCGVIGRPQLKATVVDMSSNGYSLLIINDSLNPPIIDTLLAALTPDVIITNNIANNTNNCFVAVVTASKGACPAGPGYLIGLRVYLVSNMGVAGSLTVSGPTTFDISKNPISGDFQTASLFPHIDVVAAYNNLFPSTGVRKLPQCDSFIISYTDAQPSIPAGCSVPVAHNPNYGINLYCNSMRHLIATGLPLYTINDSSKVLYPDTAMYADVAAVEKTGLSTNSLYAYVTYTDAVGKLYKSEWHPSAATLATTTLLHTNMDKYPRIDAIDDINLNGGATVSRYMIVDDTLAPREQVIAFDPVHYTTGTRISGWATTRDIHPVITCGPTNNYTVGYYHDSSAFVSFLTQQLSWTAPLLGNYYETNLTAISSFTTLNSEGLSSTCNNNGLISYVHTTYQFASWLNTATNNVYEKTIASATSWRPADVNNIPNENKWQLWPNPTNGSITIAAPDMQSGLYSITDITGRELKHGILNSNKQQINVTSLANGTYLLHIYTEDKNVQILKFVKE